MLRSIVTGLGSLLMALTLFTTSVAYAADEPNHPMFGPQPFDIKKYYYFGDSTYPKESSQGLYLALDESSVSYQSIKATLTMDYNIIQERKITKFHILRNGVMVDSLEPYFDRSITPWRYREYYWFEINVGDTFIGTENYFTVVGVSEGKYISDLGEMNDYVVAWSAPTNTVRFKPLPVTDSTSHGYLDAILNKLAELAAMLTAKLNALQKAVEDIYTPSPEATERFDQAVNELMEKMPMNELPQKMDELNDKLEQSKRSLQKPEDSDFKFGGKIRLIPELAESEVTFLDLSEFKTQVLLFRTVLSAMIWVYFFQMLLNKFTPKPGI